MQNVSTSVSIYAAARSHASRLSSWGGAKTLALAAPRGATRVAVQCTLRQALDAAVCARASGSRAGEAAAKATTAQTATRRARAARTGSDSAAPKMGTPSTATSRRTSCRTAAEEAACSAPASAALASAATQAWRKRAQAPRRRAHRNKTRHEAPAIGARGSGRAAGSGAAACSAARWAERRAGGAGGATGRARSIFLVTCRAATCATGLAEAALAVRPRLRVSQHPQPRRFTRCARCAASTRLHAAPLAPPPAQRAARVAPRRHRSRRVALHCAFRLAAHALHRRRAPHAALLCVVVRAQSVDALPHLLRAERRRVCGV